MKIVFFWTGEFSAAILKWLLEYSDVEVALVVSQNDKPVGRKMEILPTPVKQVALAHGLPLEQPEKLRGNTEFLQTLQWVQADFFVVVAYGKILPQSVLDLPKYYPLNIHGSILPKYRGASPIQESLKNGDETTWLTIMQMSLWMDEWATFKIEEIKVDIVDKTPNIFEKFAWVWPKLIYEVMQQIVDTGLTPTAQDSTKATYCTKIEKEDGRVSFHTQTAKEIYNRFRAYTPWPWIYTYFEGKKFQIEDCFFDQSLSAPVWSVICLPEKKYAIWTTSWVLILYAVKLEWKKSMDINSFINGNKNFLQYNFE